MDLIAQTFACSAEESMRHKTICGILICVIFGASNRSGTAQSDTPPETILKDRLRHTMAGTQIEVRLKNRQKMRGRLGELTDDAFALEKTNAGKVEIQSIAFRDLLSMKLVDPHEHSSMWVPIGILTAAGVAVAVVFLARAAKKPACQNEGLYGFSCSR
jgi:hypothetical protein